MSNGKSLSPSERRNLEREIKRRFERTGFHGNVRQVSVHSLDGEKKSASIVVSSPGITGDEIKAMEEEGLEFIEKYSTARKNPDMSEYVDEVSVDELSQATEVESEIVVDVSSVLREL